MLFSFSRHLFDDATLERSQDRDPRRQGGVLCEGVHVSLQVSRLAEELEGCRELKIPVVSGFRASVLDTQWTVI